MKYKSKPVVIEAIQWTGENLDELCQFVPQEFRHNKIHEAIGIATLEGVLFFKESDWIIKGTEGEFYPCKDSVFRRKYEPAEGQE